MVAIGEDLVADEHGFEQLKFVRRGVTLESARFAGSMRPANPKGDQEGTRVRQIGKSGQSVYTMWKCGVAFLRPGIQLLILRIWPLTCY